MNPKTTKGEKTMNDEEFLQRLTQRLDAKKPSPHPLAAAIRLWLKGGLLDGDQDIKAGEALCELASLYWPHHYKRTFDSFQQGDSAPAFHTAISRLDILLRRIRETCPDLSPQQRLCVSKTYWREYPYDDPKADELCQRIADLADQLFPPKAVSAMTHDIPQLTVSLQGPHRVILEVQQGGKAWEIVVRIDTDQDGGIIADIGRDSVLCTSCAFGWNEKHENEPQDDDRAECEECGCAHHADFIGHDSAEG
jgi:hypothetical protein